MKRDFLESMGLGKETIDLIMEEHGRDIEASKEKLKAYSSEVEKSRDEIAALNGKLEDAKKRAYDSANRIKELEEEKSGIASELEKLGNDLKYERRRAEVEKALSETEFLSLTAKRAVTEKLISGIQNDEDISGDVMRLIEDIRKEDPQAFLSGVDEFPVFSTAPASAYTAPDGVFEISSGFRAHPKYEM